MALVELQELTNQIRSLGNEQREIADKLAREGTLLADETYDFLVEKHNDLVRMKVDAINKFNKLSNNNVRVGLFN